MELVLMDNDPGGMVYVGKNDIKLFFADGVKFQIWINTADLLRKLEAKSKEDINGEKFLIEPYYKSSDGRLLVIISIKKTSEDENRATVFLADLVKALKETEVLV